MPKRLVEVELNQTGMLTCMKALVMSGTEGTNERVLMEGSPLIEELLVHWQLFSGEAVYEGANVCLVTNAFPPESNMVRLISSVPTPQGLGILICVLRVVLLRREGFLT
jgi:hypothetical protein